MRYSTIAALLIGVILPATACEAASSDLIVCRVDEASAPAGLAEHLCEAAAEAANATKVPAAEWSAALGSSRSKGLLHAVEIAFPSTREIAFSYAFGTASDWSEHREKHFDDLHIDVMDAELSPATVGMFADTIRRLSR